MANSSKDKAPETPTAPEPEKTVEVAYLGNHRVHHTLSGKVFEYGGKHTLTEGEWRDLQARTAVDDFEVV
jgi:hypothetical protein